MSDKSLIVAYDEQRGEPRKVKKSLQDAVTEVREGGDCISCMRCVQVCPAGVDIRDGDQLSCIACASCVDACDEVMIKIGKPTGLIRYTTDRDATGPSPLRIKTLGSRSFLYAAVLAVLTVGLLYGVVTRSPITVAVARAVSTEIFRELPNGDVTNQLTLHISNRDNADHTFTVRSATEDVTVTVPGLPWAVAWGAEERLQAFVSAPAGQFERGRLAAVILVERDDGKAVEARFDMLGPAGPASTP
jgi:cytochrome c oxidase accessory protein FixG